MAGLARRRKTATTNLRKRAGRNLLVGKFDDGRVVIVRTLRKGKQKVTIVEPEK